MQLQIDSREKKAELKRITAQFDHLGIDYFVSKLYVGDYMSLDNPRLVVDRKKDLQELIGNVTQQHERFRAELVRAKKHGIHIVILCEHGGDITTLDDLIFWHNPRLSQGTWKMQDGHPVKVLKYPKATTGQQLHKALTTMSERYDVEFVFCDKKHTGAEIVRILGGGEMNGKE